MNQEYTGTDNNIEKGCTGTDRFPNLWKVTDILIDGGYFIFFISFETLSYFRSSRASSSQLKSYLMSEKNSIYVIADRQKIYVKLRNERTDERSLLLLMW